MPKSDGQDDDPGVFAAVYRCLQAKFPRYIRRLITYSLYAFVTFYFVYMIVNPRLNHVDKYLIKVPIKVSNQAVAGYYLIIFFVGFTPPMVILTITGNWSASPFWYPQDKRWVIRAHVFFAFGWLLWSAVQVSLITLKNPDYHKASGVCLVILVFMPFVYTAMFSAYEKISPLGPHVTVMEIELALGLLTYLLAGLIAVVLDHWEWHTISMVGLCFGSGGPGLFRVLRTIREIVTRRIWRVKYYTNYADIHMDPVNLKNMHDVEATYFSITFCLEGIAVYIVYYFCGQYNDPLAITMSVVPFLIVGFNIILDYTCCKNLGFKFCLDYDFKTLKYDPKDPNFEKNKRPQSNPKDRDPSSVVKTESSVVKTEIKVSELTEMGKEI